MGGVRDEVGVTADVRVTVEVRLGVDAPVPVRLGVDDAVEGGVLLWEGFTLGVLGGVPDPDGVAARDAVAVTVPVRVSVTAPLGVAVDVTVEVGVVVGARVLAIVEVNELAPVGVGVSVTADVPVWVTAPLDVAPGLPVLLAEIDAVPVRVPVDVPDCEGVPVLLAVPVAVTVGDTEGEGVTERLEVGVTVLTGVPEEVAALVRVPDMDAVDDRDELNVASEVRDTALVPVDVFDDDTVTAPVREEAGVPDDERVDEGDPDDDGVVDTELVLVLEADTLDVLVRVPLTLPVDECDEVAVVEEDGVLLSVSGVAVLDAVVEEVADKVAAVARYRWVNNRSSSRGQRGRGGRLRGDIGRRCVCSQAVTVGGKARLNSYKCTDAGPGNCAAARAIVGGTMSVCYTRTREKPGCSHENHTSFGAVIYGNNCERSVTRANKLVAE